MNQKFKIVGIVKYHVDIGVFEAASPEAAQAIAEESHEWERQSRKAIGGFYDIEVTPVDGEANGP